MHAPSFTLSHSDRDSWEPPLDTARFTEAIVDEAATDRLGDSIGTSAGSVSHNVMATTTSWRRLVDRLEDEARVLAQAGPDIIPSIEFNDLRYVDCWYFCHSL